MFSLIKGKLAEIVWCKDSFVAVWVAFALLIVPGSMQSLAAQSFESEKWPETRDPRYTPPVLPDGLVDTEGNNELLLLLNGGSGAGLQDFLEARRKAQIKKKRAQNRYRERDTDRLLRQGQKGVVLERNLLEQFGSEGFPEDMGEYPYQETGGRRFTIVFFLALPVMAGFSYGLISGIKAMNDDGVSFDNDENAAAAVLTLSGSFGVAWYDKKRVEQFNERNRLPEPLEQRRGLIGDPPNRPVSRLNLVPSTQVAMHVNHSESQTGIPLRLHFQFQY